MIQTDPRLLLKQAGVKERMAAFDLPALQEDFYKVSKEFISNLNGEDRLQMESLLNSIILSRKSKISKLAEAVNEDPTIQTKLTPEEKELFNSIASATILFKESVMS